MKITIIVFLVLTPILIGFYVSGATAQDDAQGTQANAVVTGMNGNSSTNTQIPISSSSSSAESRKVSGVNTP